MYIYIIKEKIINTIKYYKITPCYFKENPKKTKHLSKTILHLSHLPPKPPQTTIKNITISTTSKKLSYSLKNLLTTIKNYAIFNLLKRNLKTKKGRNQMKNYKTIFNKDNYLYDYISYSAERKELCATNGRILLVEKADNGEESYLINPITMHREDYDKTPPALEKTMLENSNALLVNADKIKRYARKTKSKNNATNVVLLNGAVVDSKYFDTAIDFMDGEDFEIYFKGGTDPIFFKNDKKEAVIAPMRTFSEEDFIETGEESIKELKPAREKATKYCYILTKEGAPLFVFDAITKATDTMKKQTSLYADIEYNILELPIL